MPGRKGVKGLLQVGHKKVPHGFGLTGDRDGDTADGAREPEPQTSTSSVRYGTLDWAQGEGRTVCVCGYSKEL